MDKKFILTDILPKEKREKLIEDCKPYLKRLSGGRPAYQSDDPIRNYPPFFDIHRIFPPKNLPFFPGVSP